jgi:hypothetical protein
MTATIPGIEFHGVRGSPAEADGVLFLPALFDFDDPAGPFLRFDLTAAAPVGDWLGADDPYLDEAALLVYWARARIPRVFGFHPVSGWEADRDEVLDVPFLAVRLEPEICLSRAVPFLCVEGRRGPQLVFRTGEEDADLARRVAAAFWSLLLGDPGDLAEFRDLVYDPEGYWYTVAYERGRLSVDDFPDEDAGYDPDCEPDAHAAALRRERFPCPDCDGTGIEHWEPYTEDCATCGGTGAVTW